MFRRACWLVTAAFVGLAAPVLAQAPVSPAGVTTVPPVVRFAGTLPGAPDGVTGQHGGWPPQLVVTFTLYAQASGGEPLWTETQAVTVDVGGRYAVLLGATQAGGLPKALFAGGAARWVGVQVDGQAELPRVPLTTAPYAMKAEDATTIGGKPLSAFVLAGETTGVGEDGLTYVNPKTLAAALGGAFAPAANSGWPGYIGMFTSTTDLGASVMFQAGSSVGVNNLVPEAAFHVKSPAAPAVYFDVYATALGALPAVYRAARGTPTAPAAVQANDILGGLAVRGYGDSTFGGGVGQVMYRAAETFTDTARGTYLAMTTTPVGSALWQERVRIDPAGNVGIGTQAPAQKLSVAGTIESTAGGFKFPDGTTQTTASTGGTTYSAGTGLTLASNVFSVNFAGTGAAASASHSDHDHAGAYAALSHAHNYLPLAGGTLTGAVTFAPTQTFDASSLAGTITDSQIASLSGSKVTGTVANATSAVTAGSATTATTAVTAGSVTNGVYTTGSYNDPVWITALAGAKITGTVANATNAATATTAGSATTATTALTAGSVTNGVYTTGSYSDPAWITGLSAVKLSGTLTKTQQAPTTVYTDQANLFAADQALAPAAPATTGAGVPSPVLEIGANVWHSASQRDSFAFRADPVNNNTPTAASRLRLLYGAGTTPSPTGLSINSDGTVNFAPTQAFPAGSVEGDWTVGGNLQLSATESSGKAGLVTLDGERFLHSAGTAGVANTFVGRRAGSLATSGTGGNVGIGTQVLATNLTGFYNTAVGAHALEVANGSLNSAFGTFALQASTASSNSAFGYLALASNTTGTPLDAFGLKALSSNTTGQHNAAFGHQGLMYNVTGWYNSAFGSDSLVMSTGNGNSGFGYGALHDNTASENSAFGVQALYSNTSGTGNSAFGSAALISNTSASRNSAFGGSTLYLNTTGADNSAFGYNALLANSTGPQNTAMGSQALTANTTAGGNSAFGYRALWSNVTGVYNSAFGIGSLLKNTATGNSAFGASALASVTTAGGNSAFGYGALALSTGANNSAFGTEALVANTTAEGNSAFGYHALTANTTGSRNTAVGSEAMGMNTTGRNSTAVGWQALAGNLDGADNSAFGYAALSASTGDSNSAFGSLALRAATGSMNSAFGHNSLSANTSGFSNSALGYRTLASNTAGSANAAFGESALTNAVGSNNSAFGYWALYDNTTGSENTAVGRQALRLLTTGSRNVAVGRAAGYNVVGGSDNSFLGDGADAWPDSLTNATAIGANATVTQSNSLVLGDSAVSVGIGTGAPNTKLQVVGNIRVGTSGTNGCVQRFDGTAIAGTCASDARLKTDIRPLRSVLDRVTQLQPVSYRWRAAEFPARHYGNAVNVGLVAQDVEQVFPELVSTDAEGYKQVSGSELPYLTIAAVKELKAKSDRLEAENEALKKQLAAISDRLAKLERER